MNRKKTGFFAAWAVVIMFLAAVTLCIQALQAPQAVFSEAGVSMTIVLDAGHGGMDGGVVGRSTGVKESHLNLAITLKLKTELEELGFDVVLTRKTEAGLYDAATKGFKRRDMQKRKEIIQKAAPSMVISVHQNYYPSASTRGAQVFYNRKSEKGKKLAISLQGQLNALYETEKVKSRNVMSGEYFMLDCCDAPSAIVECGFLSSAKDETLLLNEAWQKKLAERITAGVMAYFSDNVS